jgi:class 3 adenylate cyclase
MLKAWHECEVDGKVVGVAVHVAAREAAKASPSEVLVSQTVKGLVTGSAQTLVDADEHGLKGVPGTWHLYRVEP